MGKALSENIMQNPDNQVIGVSRRSTFEHDRYDHISLNMGDYAAVKEFSFNLHPEAERITLINNAGVIGSLHHIGRQDHDVIAEVMQINAISLSCLMDKFVATYREMKVPCTVINISSGASKYPIDGWAPYCASKAAVDMFSEVAAKELSLEGIDHFRIVSIAPGVIDTDMQTEIRNSDAEEFYDRQTFIYYKTQGELQTPESTAEKIISIYKNLDNIDGVTLSARDF